jgi:hypothetical protein
MLSRPISCHPRWSNCHAETHTAYSYAPRITGRHATTARCAADRWRGRVVADHNARHAPLALPHLFDPAAMIATAARASQPLLDHRIGLALRLLPPFAPAPE